MPQFINTNIGSLNTQRSLNASQASMQNALQRLSSGLRINSAKDDAAGLAVAQKMTSQIRGLNQATRNANDGISMVQTAEGAMNEMQNMLQRMKELATQAANGAISDTERGYLATEVKNLREELDNIATRTKFNGQNLLTGALSTTLAGGSELKEGVLINTDTAVITNVDVSKAKAGATLTMTYAAATDTLTMSDGVTSQSMVIGSVTAGNTTTFDFSAFGVSFDISATTTTTADEIGTTLTTAGTDSFTTAGTGSVTLQVGAETTADNTVNLSFADMRITGGANFAALATAITNFTTAPSTASEATSLMNAVEGALNTFNSKRADLGAVLNRLESTVTNNQTTSENLVASRSRIQDADFAEETANLSRAQILQQAGTAMLAQANQMPQNVLSLLR